MARIADLLAAGRTYSVEFFPPKTDAAQLSLGRTIAELEPLAPSFVSVTYGAAGSTRQRTREVVTWVRKETAVTPMAHLTCHGHTRAEIAGIVDDYRGAQIENLLALGGDPPNDPVQGRADGVLGVRSHPMAGLAPVEDLFAGGGRHRSAQPAWARNAAHGPHRGDHLKVSR